MSKKAIPNSTNSLFDGGLLGLIGINLLFGLICLITLSFGLPWAIVVKYKWHISHTKYNHRSLIFDGNGSQLIGSYLLWMLLTIITLGIYGLFIPIKIRQWKIKHTHFADGEGVGESIFKGGVLGLLGTNILCTLLIIFTLGIGLPGAIAIKQRWETKHIVIDGYGLDFIGKGMSLLGNYIKWILLALITIGIYALWIPLKFENWIVSNTLINGTHIIEKPAGKTTSNEVEKKPNEAFENSTKIEVEQEKTIVEKKQDDLPNSPRKAKKNRYGIWNIVFNVLSILVGANSFAFAIYLIINFSTIIGISDPLVLLTFMYIYVLFFAFALYSVSLVIFCCLAFKYPSMKSSKFRGYIVYMYVIDAINVIFIPGLGLALAIIFGITFGQLFSKNVDDKIQKFNKVRKLVIALRVCSIVTFAISVVAAIVIVALYGFIFNIFTFLPVLLFVNLLISEKIAHLILKGIPLFWSREKVATDHAQPTDDIDPTMSTSDALIIEEEIKTGMRLS